MKRLRFELYDQPRVISRIVGKLANAHISVKDITYSVIDTDTGFAVCTVLISDNNGVPNLDTKIKKIEDDVVDWLDGNRSRGPYERWFRLPSVVLSLVTNDKVGVVHDLLAYLEGRINNQSSPLGSILDMKGFTLEDSGLFTVTLQVCSTDLANQARLIADFCDWCIERPVRDFDVHYSNFIYEYCQIEDSHAS